MNVRSTLFALTSVVAICPIAQAQVRPSIRVVQGPNGQLQPAPTLPTSSINVTNCISIGLPYGVGSVQIRTSGDQTSVSLGVEWTDLSDPVQVITTACGLFVPTCPIPDVDNCGPTITERVSYARLSGNVNSYVFAVGGGFSGGASFERITDGGISWSETLEISSPAATTLELPLNLTGCVFGAESFGNPDQTYARARLSLTASFAGQGVSNEVSVESVSVIPEQQCIDVTPRIPVLIPAGVSRWPISVTGRAVIETKATSAGIFGTISGAATGGADFPNSIRIMRLTGLNGSPLPQGVTVRGQTSGIYYEGRPTRTCVADVDDGSRSGMPDGGVTLDDLLYYLTLFESGSIRADVDDGSGTGTPDGGVTVDDLLYFILRYEAGC
jgi:hypothetical protein